MNYDSLNITAIDRSDISYLNKILLDPAGQLQVVPYDVLKDIPQDHLSQFCVEHGFYTMPTCELIEFLKSEIPDKEKTIEIGSGCGTIGKALGIRATDNLMQLQPKYKKHYELLNQAIVPYGSHVEKLEALAAIQKYKPHTVVGAWITHKFNPGEYSRGGNEAGVDEKKLLRKVKKYIMIGNRKIHDIKPIMEIPHREIEAPWIMSRSQGRELNVIYIWE